MGLVGAGIRSTTYSFTMSLVKPSHRSLAVKVTMDHLSGHQTERKLHTSRMQSMIAKYAHTPNYEFAPLEALTTNCGLTDFS
jgi:hypothetical protein